MGNKESKQQILTYDDAIKRVTNAELQRLKDAFERTLPASGYMSKTVFAQEVIGDNVPEKLIERLYTMFNGSSRGITYRDLVCGLVLLTQGTIDEKIKLIYGVYSNNDLTSINKAHLDEFILATEGEVPVCINQLFVLSSEVMYGEFYEWLVQYPNVTSLTRWLLCEQGNVTLTNEINTPTFYQTLAGVTHLNERDIEQLEKCYWQLKTKSPNNRLDLSTFRSLVSSIVPVAIVDLLFAVFDENQDQHIDFKEMSCGISACCRGPQTERLKFCFKIFDSNHDGLLSEEELIAMIEVMVIVRQENCTVDETSSACLGNTDSAGEAKKLIEQHDGDHDGSITQEEFLVWAQNEPLPAVFLDLLFQVCHVVLGLRPQSKEDEGRVIGGWVEREHRRCLSIGQTWYLINMTWWSKWRAYVDNKPVSFPSIKENGTVSSSSSGYGSASSSNVNSPAAHRRNHSSLAKGHNNKNHLAASDDASVIATRYTSLANDHHHHHSTSSSVSSTSSSSANNTPVHRRTDSSDSAISTKSDHSTTASVVGSAALGKKGSFSSLNSASTSSTSVSTSGGGGSTASTAPRPGQIDNSPLVLHTNSKIQVLTYEGGRLKRDKLLVRGRDYEIVSEAVWHALCAWYGGAPALPRNVIRGSDGSCELELYPICVKLMKHQIVTPPNRANNTAGPGGGSMTGVMSSGGGYSGAGVISGAVSSSVGSLPASGMMSGVIGGVTSIADSFLYSQSSSTPRYYTAYTASFSRMHTVRQIHEFLCGRLYINKDNIRLFIYKNENNVTLLEDDRKTVQELGIQDGGQILIDIRNKDMSWPQEIVELAKTKNMVDKKQVRSEKGVTGLNNLGNTCFMNSALQCVSNTQALTMYLDENMHLYELNKDNPLGMKGHVAQRYAELVKDLWSGLARTVAPLKLRWTICKYAPQFNGCLQHDSQELLAFLLDGLHEDLNRVHDKPYVELKDSDGRCDEIVAKEAWDNHLRRNQSVIVDLFHGQLKSQVRCLACGHTSVRFDPFTFLHLPLPMDSALHMEVIVIKLDGTTPVKYGMRLNTEKLYKSLKSELSALCGIPEARLLLVEICGTLVKFLPHDNHKIKNQANLYLYAYELPEYATHTANDCDTTATMIPAAPCDTTPSATSSSSNSGLSTIQRTPGKATASKVTPDHNANSKGSMANGKLPHTHNTASPNHGTPNHKSTNRGAAKHRPTNHNTPTHNGKQATPTHTPPANHSSAKSVSHKLPASSLSNHVSAATGSPSLNGNDGRGDGNASNTNTTFIVGVHRKMNRMDVYFLSNQKARPQLFGTPLILSYQPDVTTHKDLYGLVWTQVSRLVSPLPPQQQEGNAGGGGRGNHAKDCDDSLCYEYPFTIKLVQRDGLTCAACPWYRFCRGCALQCDDTVYDYNITDFVAVDWEPNALHLRYQSNQEKAFISDASITESRRQQTEPIDLDDCLRSFTREEQLGADEQVHCSKCKKHQQVAKKLEVWRLPPILIVHLKRFQQLMDSRWVKSHKIVKFPVTGFDPNGYIAPRKPGDYRRFLAERRVAHAEGGVGSTSPLAGRDCDKEVFDLSDSDSDDDGCDSNSDNNTDTPTHNKPGAGRSRATPPTSPAVRDVQERERHLSTMSIESAEDYTDVRYRLYALSCHSGVLGGGHYVSYAKNPNNKWYLYNDSSCKEVTESEIDYNSAYILFYERNDIDHTSFLPDVRNKQRVSGAGEVDDECEADLKKSCTLQ